MIGKPYSQLDPRYFNIWDFDVTQGPNDRCQISVPGNSSQQYSVEQISAMVLESMKKAV